MVGLRTGLVAAVALGAVAACAAQSGSGAASTATSPSTLAASPSSSPSSATVPWAKLPSNAAALSGALTDGAVQARLITDGAAQPGRRFRFVVTLLNNSAAPISLTPCPSYRVQLQKVVEAGTLNCAAAPPSVPASGHLDFAMEVGVAPDVPMSSAPLLWQLGGEADEGKAPTAQTNLAWTS